MAVGERIQSNPAFSKPHQLYHINFNRYCLLRKDIQIDEARSNALSLKARLTEEYHIFTRRAALPSASLKLMDVTVRLGVHSYTYEKLEELLGRYSPEFAVSAVSKVLLSNIDSMLVVGQDSDNKALISWDREKWKYVTLPSE